MIKTLQELYPTATKEQIRANQKALMKDVVKNGYIDEDMPDSEGMDARYTDWEGMKR